MCRRLSRRDSDIVASMTTSAESGRTAGAATHPASSPRRRGSSKTQALVVVQGVTAYDTRSSAGLKANLPNRRLNAILHGLNRRRANVAGATFHRRPAIIT
jgi:hypothetical protein